MARKERIVLEPSEVAVEGRVEIDIHDGAIQVGEAGPDWGDYVVEQFLAKRKLGLVPVDEEIPNRVIPIPLNLGATGDFDAARLSLQAWATQVNDDGGGTLKRELIGGSYGEAGGKLFADCIKASLKLGGGTSQARDGVDTDAVLTIEALPDFYGETETLEPFEGVGRATGIFKIKGALPARLDLTVIDKSGKDQMGLAYHIRCRNYSAAETARWWYEAEALTKLDAATEVTLAGAGGEKAIRHNNLGTNWTPVLGFRLKAGTYLTHAGLYDVWARVYSTSSELPWLRLLYDTGDIVSPAENAQVQVRWRNGFYEVYLGQANLQKAPFGAHRWYGVIQARGEAGGENIYIDSVEMRCADEASGVILGRTEPTEPFAANYIVRDEFNQAGGAATGKTPAIGTVYQALTNSDTDDFEVDATTHRLKRASVSDSGTIGSTDTWHGRGLGTAAEQTNVALRCSFTAEGSELSNLLLGGVVSYVNDSNFMIAHISPSGNGWYLSVYRADNNGEGYSAPLRVPLPTSGVVSGTFLVVVRGNRLTVFCAAAGEGLQEEAVVENAMIGVKGKAFVYDENRGASAITRWYDNFSVWTPEVDAAIFANRDLRISDTGIFRRSEDNAGYGPAAYPGADCPRLPVSGPDGRLVEIGLRSSRGNFGSSPDTELGALKGLLAYRPCWPTVPGL